MWSKLFIFASIFIFVNGCASAQKSNDTTRLASLEQIYASSEQIQSPRSIDDIRVAIDGVFLASSESMNSFESPALAQQNSKAQRLRKIIDSVRAHNEVKLTLASPTE